MRRSRSPETPDFKSTEHMSIEFLMNKEVWTCIHSLRSQIPIGSFEKLQPTMYLIVVFEGVLVNVTPTTNEVPVFQQNFKSNQRIYPKDGKADTLLKVSKRPGMKRFFQILSQDYTIIIVSNVSPEIVIETLKTEGVLEFVSSIYSYKKSRSHTLEESRAKRVVDYSVLNMIFLTSPESIRLFPYQSSSLLSIKAYEDEEFDQTLICITDFLSRDFKYQEEKGQIVSVQEKFSQYLLETQSPNYEMLTPNFELLDLKTVGSLGPENNPIPDLFSETFKNRVPFQAKLKPLENQSKRSEKKLIETQDDQLRYLNKKTTESTEGEECSTPTNTFNPSVHKLRVLSSPDPQ